MPTRTLYSTAIRRDLIQDAASLRLRAFARMLVQSRMDPNRRKDMLAAYKDGQTSILEECTALGYLK